MQTLNLNPQQPPSKQLRASEFPELADVYVCDDCGRDITAHLHSGRAHVRQPLGPARYVCRCGQKYQSGAAEWDNLSNWAKRQWLGDVGLALILLAASAVWALLVRYAATHHSIVLFALSAAAVLLSMPLFPLFIALLAVPIEIAASIWRTRGIGEAHSGKTS
jgi:hypothetical protein